ncbi:MAG: CHAD domain-containing protein [Alphaproteobacteria bacterium]|nr:CHAD domain-containing protein [Alphaproteobacteria bacterium]
MRTSLLFDRPFEEAVATKLADGLGKAGARAHDEDRTIEDRVHRARVAVKELRAFLRLVRPALRYYRVLNVGLRDTARRLAHHRDSVVRAQLLTELFASAPPLSGLGDFAGRIDELAGPPPSPFEQEALLDAFARDIAALAGNNVLWRVENRDWTCLADGVALSYRAARRYMIEAERSGVPNDFHDWRKQVKYHAIQLALLTPLRHGPSEQRCKSVAQLGELLGRHHDFEALADHLANAAGLEPDAVRRFNAAIDPLKTGLERTAIRLGGMKFRQPPGKIRHAIAKALRSRNDGAAAG